MREHDGGPARTLEAAGDEAVRQRVLRADFASTSKTRRRRLRDFHYSKQHTDSSISIDSTRICPIYRSDLLKGYAGMHFAYDERGNLIAKRTPKGEQKYEWDAFNRLSTAMVQEGDRRITASYFYDALGRRIAKSVNGEHTLFGWDGDTLAYESAERGSTHYVYEAGSFVPLAQFVTHEPVQGRPTPVWTSTDRYLPEEDPLQHIPQPVAQAHLFYYHCDHIGTPYMMTDELGDVVWDEGKNRINVRKHGIDFNDAIDVFSHPY